MKRLARWLLTVLAVLAPLAAAFGQGALLQGGPTTPGHVPQYASQGTSQAVVIDGGGAGGGAVGVNPGEFGLTARGTGTPPYVGQGTGPFGTNWCDYDAPTNNATGYHYLCFSANSNQVSPAGGVIAYGAGGTAAQLPLSLVLNGVTYQFPFSGGGGGGSTGYPPRYISGFQTVYNTATTIDFGVGNCRDSLNAVNINLLSGQTKILNLPWVAGTNQGGLQQGLTFSAGTFYYLFAIYRGDTAIADYFISDNYSAPTLPASYTNFCRFGAVLTELVTAQVRRFVQDVSTNTWWLTTAALTTQAVNITPLLLSTQVPPIQGVQGIFNASAFSLTTNYGVCIRPGFSPCVSTNQDGYTVASSVSGTNSGVQIRVPVNSSRQISVVGCPASDGCSAAGVLQIWLLGWQDNF